MGCDIHIQVQRCLMDGSWGALFVRDALEEASMLDLVRKRKHPTSLWVRGGELCWPTSRNYALFDALAGVRYGMPGEFVDHLAERRGFPEGFVDDEFFDETHSHTWATLDEFLNWSGWMSRTVNGDRLFWTVDWEFMEMIFSVLPRICDDPKDIRIIMGFDN